MKKQDSVVRALKACIELHGGRQNLAEQIGICHTSISNWIQAKKVPIARAYQISKLSFGKISFEELTGAKVLGDE